MENNDCFIEIFDPPLEHMRKSHLDSVRGKTVAVKDNFDILGTITGAGNPVWSASHDAANAHAKAVQLLMDSGAKIFGKTHMDELAYSLMGVNHHTGTPPNPKAPDRVCGGSSSGSASAVAQGLCDIGLGSDTGGSVRLPASFCGLYGMRTSHGAISTEGMVPLAPSYDSVGFFSQRASDLVDLSAVLMPKADVTPFVNARFWAPRDVWALADKQTQEVLHRYCSTLPLRVIDDAPLFSICSVPNWLETFRLHQAWEVWQVLGGWIEMHDPQFGSGLKERFAAASAVTQAQFEQAQSEREFIRKALSEHVDPSVVIIIPTAPGPAPLRSAYMEGLEEYRERALSMLCIAGHGGLPQISVPAGQLDGAPIGLSFIAAGGRDYGLAAWVAQSFS